MLNIPKINLYNLPNNFNKIVNKIGYKFNYLFILWLTYPIIDYFVSKFNLGFKISLKLNFFNFPIAFDFRIVILEDNKKISYYDD